MKSIHRSDRAIAAALAVSLAAASLGDSAWAAEADDPAEAAPPAPVKRYSTLSLVDQSADALGESLPFDEVESVSEGEDIYWRVYRTAPRGERGTIVLAAAANVAPSARSIATLRESLPGWGWSTVSVPLPEAPAPLLPDRDRFAPEPTTQAEGEDPAKPAPSRPAAKEDADAGEAPTPPQRPAPLTYDAGALAARQAERQQDHQARLEARIADSVAAARSRSAGGPVVLLAAGDAAGWVAGAGAGSGADALVLIDLDVVGADRASVRTALADLSLPALILQHAPRRWHPSHRLGAAVELHLLPPRSEQRLARRVHGYLKRNTKKAARG